MIAVVVAVFAVYSDCTFDPMVVVAVLAVYSDHTFDPTVASEAEDYSFPKELPFHNIHSLQSVCHSHN